LWQANEAKLWNSRARRRAWWETKREAEEIEVRGDEGGRLKAEGGGRGLAGGGFQRKFRECFNAEDTKKGKERGARRRLGDGTWEAERRRQKAKGKNVE